MLHLSTYSIWVDKIETWLAYAMLYNTIQYNTIVELRDPIKDEKPILQKS